jgi:type IV secretion system protein TrbL
MPWTDCMLSPASCAVKEAGNEAVESVWESFLRWSAQGLSDLSATVFNAFSTSTAPGFNERWWRENLDLIVAVSLPVLVAAFILQCLSGVVRREPGYLGRAVIGAFIGTAGVPFAVGVVGACGRAADEISMAILGNTVTADGYRRMTDIGAVISVGTAGGFLLLAVFLGLIALFSLYFVMLLREVALLAFVVFAPVALIGWTWSSTRHWLRRWIEIVGALLFSKVAMAAVFTLGVSATGMSGQAASLGTFLSGIMLVALAALAPMVTLSFIHWAGDQGHAAVRSMQQGSKGVEAARDHVQDAREWRAEHLGAKQDTGPTVVGDNPDNDRAMDPKPADTDVPESTVPDDAADEDSSDKRTPTDDQGGDVRPDGSAPLGSDAGTPIAVANASASVDGARRGGDGQPAVLVDRAEDRQSDVPGPTHTKEP